MCTNYCLNITSDDTNLALASLTAFVKPARAARWKIGASRPRKSAPTRLKDSPKYMHCPSTESRRPPTPSCTSLSSVCRNCVTYKPMSDRSAERTQYHTRTSRSFLDAWRTITSWFYYQYLLLISKAVSLCHTFSNYLHQGGYVFIGVSVFVCLLAWLRNNYSADFHK